MKKIESILELPNSKVRFSANIFYRLLLGSMKHRFVPGDNFKKDKNNIKLTQTHLFYDLNALINSPNAFLGDYSTLFIKGALQGTQKNAANNFKYGIVKVENSNVYSFNNKKIIADFNFKVEHNYEEVLEKAVKFANIYFGTDNSVNERLIKKILFLIINDIDINDSQVFYICSNGSTKTKDDLKNIKIIEFEAFLLGVWHYLLVAQKLQADLKGVDDISIGSEYEQINVKLIYYHLQKEQILKAASDISNNGKKNASKYSGSEIIPPYDDSDLYPMELDRDTDIISVLEKNDIRLSRAIFFYLLTNNIQTIHPKRNKNVIEKLFIDLLNLTVDNNCSIDFNEKDVRKEYNKFKHLKNNSGADCLDNATEINAFTDKLYTNYDEVLSYMIKIRKKYFNSDNSNEALVVELIEFIKNDNNIDDNQEFFVCSDGSPMTKAELCDAEELEFEPLLLGVWHYVVSLLDSVDSADEYTFDKVFRVRYKSNGTDHTIYRTGDIISEQSELYVELTYLED